LAVGNGRGTTQENNPEAPICILTDDCVWGMWIKALDWRRIFKSREQNSAYIFSPCDQRYYGFVADSSSLRFRLFILRIPHHRLSSVKHPQRGVRATYMLQYRDTHLRNTYALPILLTSQCKTSLVDVLIRRQWWHTHTHAHGLSFNRKWRPDTRTVHELCGNFRQRGAILVNGPSQNQTVIVPLDTEARNKTAFSKQTKRLSSYQAHRNISHHFMKVNVLTSWSITLNDNFKLCDVFFNRNWRLRAVRAVWTFPLHETARLCTTVELWRERSTERGKFLDQLSISKIIQFSYGVLSYQTRRNGASMPIILTSPYSQKPANATHSTHKSSPHPHVVLLHDSEQIRAIEKSRNRLGK
jgi:hypothetical protein